MAVYINRGTGSVTLFVNDVQIAHKKFQTVKHRKAIMSVWIKAFSGFTYFGKVYIQVIHANNTKTLVNELPEITEEKKNLPTSFERPKGEYSNRQFQNYN